MKIKRFFLASLLLSTVCVFANRMDEISITNDETSLVTYGLEFRSLILKPSSNNLYYAAEAVPLPLPSPYWNIFAINPDYHYGFDLRGSAYFHARDSELSLQWEHFSSTDSDGKNVGTNNMVGPFFEIGPDALPYKEVVAQARFKYDSIGLNYGHAFCKHDYLRATVFGGINVTRLKECIFSRFSNPDQTIIRTITVPATFTGAGPQAGVVAQSRLINNIYLSGKISGALLVGKQKNNTFFTAESPALADLGIASPNKQKICVDSIDSVIPWFYQRIGIAYVPSCFTICECVLEVGYESRVYMNALQTINLNSEVNTPPVTPDTVGVFARTFNKAVSNFSLGGPYITLAISF